MEQRNSDYTVLKRQIQEGYDVEEISVFIDESGVIQKGELDAPDFFVIGMVFTSNEKLVKKVFTKRRLKQLTKAELEELRLTKEIKGSHMSGARKAPIYEALVEKCAEELELGILAGQPSAQRPLLCQSVQKLYPVSSRGSSRPAA